MTAESQGRELFIVDNSVSRWTGLRYLEEWADIAKSFDAPVAASLVRRRPAAARRGEREQQRWLAARDGAFHHYNAALKSGRAGRKGSAPAYPGWLAGTR